MRWQHLYLTERLVGQPDSLKHFQTDVHFLVIVIYVLSETEVVWDSFAAGNGRCLLEE